MKVHLNIKNLFILTISIVLLGSCSDNEDDVVVTEICNNGVDDDGDGFIDCSDFDCEESTFCIQADTSGVIEFTSQGISTFTINQVEQITATITIIGGGGGGAGGQQTEPTAIAASYSGGGGGGAGEVKNLDNVTLETSTTYEVEVGTSGSAGSIDQDGGNGLSSKISILGSINLLVESAGGNGGKASNSFQTGGVGGTGFPSGSSGVSGSINNNPGGVGGVGGDNASGYGNGGNGGSGKPKVSGSANPGNPGQTGYIRIEWEGKKQ